MNIGFDPAKREWTLKHRYLDFLDAEEVLAGRQFTWADTRKDYGESRYLTMGLLRGRLVVLCWTLRSHDGEPIRHIISMRKANEREKARFEDRFR